MPTYKSPQVHLHPVTDFSAGLNLRADAFQLEPGESPDMENVDVDPSGGFGLRKGVGVLNTTALSSQPKNIWLWSVPGSTAQVVVQEGSGFKTYTTGAAFGALENPGTRTVNGRMQAAMHTDFLYIMRNRETYAARWSGTADTELADPSGPGADPTSYNDNFAAAVGNNMPAARYVASHRGYLFVGNIDESGTILRNRIRFSHPGRPEDWRTNDFIDVEIGVEGDEITGLHSFGNQLLIFKNNSVHILEGYDADTFAVVNLTNSAGAVSQQAIAASESGVFFFAWPHGIMFYDGRKVTHLWDRLSPALASIPEAQQGKIALAWLNRRLWVSVPWNGSTDNERVFVFNPAVGRNGAWTAYELKLGPMIEWQPPGTSTLALACSNLSTSHRIFKLDQSTAYDVFDGSGTQTHIDSYYTTRWLDPTKPAQRKRFRRPEFVVDADETATLTVNVQKDFDSSVIRRSFPLVITQVGDTLDWGENWGLPWSGDVSTGVQRLLRGLGLGTARAVQFKVNGPTANAKWGVNSISLPYLPKKIR